MFIGNFNFEMKIIASLQNLGTFLLNQLFQVFMKAVVLVKKISDQNIILIKNLYMRS